MGFFDWDCLSSSSSAYFWASSSPSLRAALSWAHSPRCPPWEWLLEGVSFRSDFFFFRSSLSGLGMLSGEATWHHFWFSVSLDLLRLLEDGHDSGLSASLECLQCLGFLEVLECFCFPLNISVKSPPSSLLEPDLNPELSSNPEPWSEPGSEQW